MESVSPGGSGPSSLSCNHCGVFWLTGGVGLLIVLATGDAHPHSVSAATACNQRSNLP
jgi:hypothetical protein